MRFLIPALILSAAPCLPLHAADSPAVTDPAQAGADYAVQGEYTGMLDGKKTGVQVVAQDGGKFAVVLYPGGLPGDGWSGDKATREKGTAATTEGKTSVTIGKRSGTIADGTLTLGSDKLARTERKSPTLGAKAPEGAVVLFDGKDASAWNGKGMSADKLLTEGNDSKQKFGSYTLHLEFLLPWQPAARGQGRGNSGVYHQSRYECQVLDSFGLEGADNECGGIYSISPPDLNMCLPPLQWQTYDVDYTAAVWEDGKKKANPRITVKLNGVEIHKNRELTHATTASPLGEGPEPGPLHLQNHGNPVRYRNIWLVEKKP